MSARRLAAAAASAAGLVLASRSALLYYSARAPGGVSASTAAAADVLVAWVPTVSGTSPPLADAMARVPRTAPAGPERTAHVWAARGETQGFAVVVRAPAEGAMTSLSVTPSALACASGGCAGHAIPAEDVDVYRAMYAIVTTPSGRGDRAFRGRTHRDGPPGANTASDPGNGSLCGKGRPFGPPPCAIPDGLIPYETCGDGSAPPCEPGDTRRPNRCAVDGTGCGPGAPPLTIAAGTNQQLWVAVRIPRGRAGVPAGVYAGSIRLAAVAGAALAATIAVRVHVWDFDVPASPSFRTAFGTNGGSQPSAFYNVEAQAMFAKHKVSLARYGSTKTMGVDDWPRADYGPTATRLAQAWGVPNALQVGLYHGVSGSTCVISWSASDYLTTEAAQAWVARHGLPTSGVLLYARNGDEINSGLAEAGRAPFPYSSQRRRPDGSPGCAETCGWCTYSYLREAARQMHATKGPEVKLLSVVDPNPFLVRDTADLRGTGRPALDVFVVAPSFGWDNPSAVASVTTNPMPSEIWTHQMWLPDTYSPKWLLDYSPVSYRMGFIAQALGVSGAATAELADGSDPGCDAGAACPARRARPSENPWRNGVHKDVCGGSGGPNCSVNGDSQWLYTGSQVGLGRWSLVPHLRLEFFRDGIQDFELVRILRSLARGRRHASGACTAAFPAQTCAQVVKAVGGDDWSSYSTDAHLLQRARKAIGDTIAADPLRPLAHR
ncbi:MAG TPA: hypothetical protein VF912_11490 [Anaeromyxobacter sp.]